MDVRPRAPQSVGMHATGTRSAEPSASHVSLDALAGLACAPAAADALISPGVEVADDAQTVEPLSESLKDASTSRLVCLLRHWTWADESLAQFDSQRAGARDESGTYHRWCALLCGFTEAALERGLLPSWQLDALRPDLEASIAGLRFSRQMFVAIPASLAEQPESADGEHTLSRLRRIHHAFGNALREERISREIELLLFEH
jgi:hypothetical protein